MSRPQILEDTYKDLVREGPDFGTIRWGVSVDMFDSVSDLEDLSTWLVRIHCSSTKSQSANSICSPSEGIDSM